MLTRSKVSRLVYDIRIWKNRRRDWARLLSLLAEWERRTDHDLGPGLVIGQAYLQIFSDGSGYVVTELHTKADVKVGGVDLSKLITNLGMEGRQQRMVGFDNYAMAREVLSTPLKVNWQEDVKP